MDNEKLGGGQGTSGAAGGPEVGKKLTAGSRISKSSAQRKKGASFKKKGEQRGEMVEKQVGGIKCKGQDVRNHGKAESPEVRIQRPSRKGAQEGGK